MGSCCCNEERVQENMVQIFNLNNDDNKQVPIEIIDKNPEQIQDESSKKRPNRESNSKYRESPKEQQNYIVVKDKKQKQQKIQKSYQQDQNFEQLQLFGLQNNYQFCQLNSCIQCLMSIQDLKVYYLSKQYEQNNNQSQENKNQTFSNEFHQILKYTQNEQNKSRFQKVLKLKNFNTLIQNDFNDLLENNCHEFIIYLYNQLSDEIDQNNYRQPLDVNIQSVEIWNQFDQQFQSIFNKKFTAIEKIFKKCSICQNTNHQLQYNKTFILDIQNSNSIIDSLEQYKMTKEIGNYQCDHCQNNNAILQLTKRIMILPDIFTFILQRFNKIDSEIEKNNKHIDFDEMLKLKHLVQAKEKNNERNKKSKYCLQGIIVHSGSNKGGHYVAYCKKEDDNWYYFNDSKYEQVKLSQVQKKQAYILFYKRKIN